MKKRSKGREDGLSQAAPGTAQQRLRIIGGRWRGRQIRYSGDSVTRPMKDNIREAMFNLIGGWIPGKFVIDLFAGTGAIGLEALSRGAQHALLIERHIPTAKIIEQNAADLGAAGETTVVTSDTFFWSRQFLKQPVPTDRAWAVFCSPPYELYVSQTQAMLTLIESLLEAAPQDSVFVVESDSRFDSSLLPRHSQWRVRHYSPAVLHIWRPKDTTTKG
jgi:16S rRNA (guanine(966)-N(2))-methyltransferase RsmD